jgi:transcriptional regulator GlxA family with amidase domain
MGLMIAEGPSPPDQQPDPWVALPHPGIRRALVYMGGQCHRRLPLAEVASIADMSPFHFSRLFHRIVGVTFKGHLVRLRLRNADQMMRHDPSAPLGRVAARTGFGTLRNLQDHYRRVYGCPPSQGRATAAAPPTAAAPGGEQDPWPPAQDPAHPDGPHP